MSRGIIVATPNTKLSEKKTHAFDTDSNYLKLDVRHQPKFFDFLKYKVPTGITYPATGNYTEFPIATINHGLGYVPQVLLYTYSYDYAGSYVSAGSYQLGRMSIQSALFFDESFDYYADSQKLYIYYIISNQKPADPGGGAAVGAGFTFGFKYLLFSNEIVGG